MRLPSRRSLRVQVVAVLALALSPLLVLSLIQGIIEYRAEEQAQLDRLYATAKLASDELESSLERAQGLTDAVAGRAFAFLGDAQRCGVALQRVIAPYPIVSNIAIVDAEGAVGCSARPNGARVNASGDAWFAALADGRETVFSRVMFGQMSERSVMIAGRRLQTQEGEFVGAVAAAIDVVAAARLVREDLLPADAVLAIISAEQALAFSGPVNSVDLSDLPVDLRQASRSPPGPSLVENAGFAPGHAVIVTPLAGDELELLLAVPETALDAWGGADAIATFALPSLMWLMALVCTWIAVDYFVLRWLSYLRKLARVYGSGRLDVAPTRARRAPAEVRELADTMSRMAGSLDTRTEELESALDQRGALLREIHHRVKNNLQVIVSLLNLQAGRMETREAREALYEARRRINALALVHRTLYEAEDLRLVAMRSFLQELSRQLEEVSRTADCNVAVEVESEEIELEPDKAVPLALFITEAVTNAFKHAFRGREDGLIRLRFRRGPDGRCEASISDAGTGLSDEAETGTGSTLMTAFTQQIGGETEMLESDLGGVEVRLTFEGAINR